ncbi:MAG: hypothetical protein RL456_3001 [Pseudomonadota bacterium]|jgi:hypothetical protein
MNPLRARLPAIACLASLTLVAGHGALDAADPFSTRWVNVPDLAVWKPAAGGFGSALLLGHGPMPDGKALFTCAPSTGASANDLSILTFDPASNLWSWRAAFPSTVRSAFYVDGPYLFPLSGTRALVLTRFSTSTTSWKVWIYDDAGSGSFTALADLATGSSSFSTPFAARLGNDNLLVFPVSRTGPSFVFDPAGNTWSAGPAGPPVDSKVMPSDSLGRFAAPLPSGESFVWGITDNTNGFATRLDAAGSGWSTTLVTTDRSVLNVTSPLIADRFYGTSSGGTDVYAYSINDGSFVPMPTGFVRFANSLDTACFRLRSLGRDWLGLISSPGMSDANYGRFSGSVFDRASGTWFALPQTDKILYNTSGGRSSVVRHLANGVLLAGLTSSTGIVRTRRLEVTSGTGSISPLIVDDVAPLSLVEGTTTSLTYHVDGDIPAEGVTVVAERASGGSGSLAVVQGAIQLVRSNSDYKTVRVAALPDGNAVTDTATLRLRIVGASADPHARSVTVTITEAAVQPPSLAGDVTGDGVVNAFDLQAVVDTFGQSR